MFLKTFMNNFTEILPEMFQEDLCNSNNQHLFIYETAQQNNVLFIDSSVVIRCLQWCTL